MGLLAGLLILGGSPAQAAGSKVSVMPFSGPRAAALRGQVVEALCKEFDCLPQTKVVVKGKPDWKRAKKEGLGAVVTGHVVKVKKKLRVEVSVLTGAGKPAWKKTLPVGAGGKLEASGLAGLRSAVEAHVRREEVPLVAPLARKEEPPPAPAEPEPPLPSRTPSAPEPVAVREPEPAPPTPVEEIGETTPRFPPTFVAQVGTELFSRTFDYQGLTTDNLRTYRAPLVIAPRLRLELYPLARVVRGVAGGLGVEGDYFMALGLKSRRKGADVAYPTTLTRLDVAARLRLMPFGVDSASVTPLLGLRLTDFKLGAASDGSVLSGIPAVSYQAGRVGLGVDVPLLDGKLAVGGEAAVLLVMKSGEILSTAYFPSGQASGLEVALGAGFRVVPSFEVRAEGRLTRTQLSFKTAPEDTYVASGATDQNLGGGLSLRYRY